MYLCVCVYIYIHTYVYVYLYINIYMCMYIKIRIYIYIHACVRCLNITGLSSFTRTRSPGPEAVEAGLASGFRRGHVRFRPVPGGPPEAKINMYIYRYVRRTPHPVNSGIIGIG